MTDAEGPRKSSDDPQVEGPRESSDNPRAVQVAEYLWEEYRYRHDLVWKLVFRVTAVATALLLAPFLADKSVRNVVGNWLLFLPGLAIAVILIGFYVLSKELELLNNIRNAYRQVQNEALCHLQPPHWTPHPPPKPEELRLLKQLKELAFDARVTLFMLLLLLTAVAFFVLFRFAWLPGLTTRE
jgi:hypothetical protein